MNMTENPLKISKLEIQYIDMYVYMYTYINYIITKFVYSKKQYLIQDLCPDHIISTYKSVRKRQTTQPFQRTKYLMRHIIREDTKMINKRMEMCST